jgi:hypothetical protein
MIVKFSTRFGTLTMHGESAVRLLHAMGHSGTVPGAMLAADLPGALAILHRALETEGDQPSPPVTLRPGEEEDDEQREREPPVSLRKRAVPLIDMLETAIARNSDLMWDRG